MIAKAVANNLAEKISEKRGEKIKGLLPSTSRARAPEQVRGRDRAQIREIFVKAKEKAADDVPVVVFFDEMDAALPHPRHRHLLGRGDDHSCPSSSPRSTAWKGCGNVIVIGASNRQDLIDPAILRPGRLDVKDQDRAAGSRRGRATSSGST